MEGPCRLRFAWRRCTRGALSPCMLDAPADKGPKFVDHGGRFSIFLRRLRELISVTLQRGNAAFIRKWLDICVPKGAATPALGTPAPPR